VPPDRPLSVVLPLVDDRGLAVRSARAWARQTLAADCYEVVAVDGGSDPRMAAEVKRCLRDRDRLLERPGRGEIELYDSGARAAAGTTLLFTESHCVPDEGAAEALLRHLDETGSVAATLASGHLPRGRLAELETLVGDRAQGRCSEERWWAVASLRGLAVRRDVFLDIGGFQTQLERFAETVLAVELERRGCRATRAVSARVDHGDCESPRELEGALRGLGRGRARLLAEGIPEPLQPWLLGLDGVSRTDIDRRVALGLCRAVLARLTTRTGGLPLHSALSTLRILAPTAVAGPSGALLAGRVRARFALWRCALGLDPMPRRLRLFEGAWRTLARCGEIEVQGDRALPPPVGARPPFDLLPGEMSPDSLMGFHGRERDREGSFRWTGPFGLVRLSLPRGTYRLAAHLMRHPGERDLGLLWNGEPVRLEDDDASGERWRARIVVREDGEQHLAILAAPFSPRSAGLEDERTLGVAIRRLSFAPC